MGKIMAIDFGKKRTGIAVTDDFQIIASGLDTVETSALMNFLQQYFAENQVVEVVVVRCRATGEVVTVHMDARLKTVHRDIVEESKQAIVDMEAYRARYTLARPFEVQILHAPISSSRTRRWCGVRVDLNQWATPGTT